MPELAAIFKQGPSPRARGRQLDDRLQEFVGGTIPARAGETG